MNAINHSDLSSQDQIKTQHSLIFALVEHCGGQVELSDPDALSKPGPVMIKEGEGGTVIVYSRPLNANVKEPV